MRTPTAKKTIYAVELDCPHCGETLAAPSGSLFWTVEEIQLAGGSGACESCTKPFRFPKV